MSEAEPTRNGNTPEGHDQFTVADMANENAKFFNSRPDADDRLEKAREAPGVEPKLFPPGQSPEWMYHGESPESSDETVVDGDTDESDGRQPELDDRGKPQMPTGNDLPENKPSVDQDPVDWLPSHFIDSIQGTPTVNRKGYAVIASKYNVSVEAEPVVRASETGFEHAEFRAVATTENGQTYSGFGSAHVDRQDGDDPYLLNELAETRSMKRAVAWATGVGMTAIEELQNP